MSGVSSSSSLETMADVTTSSSLIIVSSAMIVVKGGEICSVLVGCASSDAMMVFNVAVAVGALTSGEGEDIAKGVDGDSRTGRGPVTVVAGTVAAGGDVRTASAVVTANI